MHNLKALCTIDPILVSQRVYHNIKCSAQFLFHCSQCSSYKGVPLSHYLTVSRPSDQVRWTQLNVFLQSLPKHSNLLLIEFHITFPTFAPVVRTFVQLSEDRFKLRQ